MQPQASARHQSAHRAVWRLHFYAGLFALPFILWLSLTGSIYLFKPDIDRLEEARFVRAGPTAPAIGADAQVAAALAAHPDARLAAYRLSEHPGEAARVDLEWPDGRKRQVFVEAGAPVVTGSLDPNTRFTETVRKLHSELLLGERGSRLTELAASWAFVLLATGLYLWWPRGQGLAGTLWPRWQPQARWRDLHAVTGVWVSALLLLILLTAMPWTGVWGEAFKGLREAAGAPAARFAAAPKPDWATRHDSGPSGSINSLPAGAMPIETVARMAPGFGLAPPLLVVPPGVKGPDYVVASEAPSIAARGSVLLDPYTGLMVRRDGLENRNPVSRVVILGIAWHEGQLFGRVNQAIGLLTATALVLMSVSAFRLWRRRKPGGALGAPPPHSRARTALLVAVLLPAALLLPMLGASLLLVVLLEQALRFWPPAREWLGLRPI
jgi:uncharacterized iron-regulated membrane protein